MRMEGRRDPRAECPDRSRAYDSGDTTQGIDIGVDGDGKREKCDSTFPEESKSEEETILGKSFLE